MDAELTSLRYVVRALDRAEAAGAYVPDYAALILPHLPSRADRLWRRLPMIAVTERMAAIDDLEAAGLLRRTRASWNGSVHYERVT